MNMNIQSLQLFSHQYQLSSLSCQGITFLAFLENKNKKRVCTANFYTQNNMPTRGYSYNVASENYPPQKKKRRKKLFIFENFLPPVIRHRKSTFFPRILNSLYFFPANTNYVRIDKNFNSIEKFEHQILSYSQNLGLYIFFFQTNLHKFLFLNICREQTC